MTKLLIGCVIGALVMFVWGFVYWALLPISSMVFDGSTDESALAAQLKTLPASGTYLVPAIGLFDTDPDEYMRRHEAGPVATIFVHLEGRPAGALSTYALGFLNMLVSVLIMGFLLRLAAPGLSGYGTRIGFVVIAGLVGVVLSDLGNPIWWLHPWPLYIANAVFHTVAWLLVGLVLGKVVKAGQ